MNDPSDETMQDSKDSISSSSNVTPDLLKIAQMLENLQTSMQTNNEKITTSLTRLEADLSNVKTEVSGLARGLTKVQSDVTSLGTEVASLKTELTTVKGSVTRIEEKVSKIEKLQGKLFEEAARVRIAKEFGSQFAKEFHVDGLLGLCRLVSKKPRSETDVRVQTSNEKKLLLHMFGKKDEYVGALGKLARKSDLKNELNLFAQKVMRLDENGFITVCLEDANKALVLALFCSKYVFSRPLKKMQFDCRGDMIDGDEIVLRTLEMKRSENKDGEAVVQAFEHLGAMIAASEIINGKRTRGRAMVLILEADKYDSEVVKPKDAVTMFDKLIDIVSPVFK